MVAVYQQERLLILQEVDNKLEQSWGHLKDILTQISIYAIVFMTLLLSLPFAMGFIVGRVIWKKSS